MNFNLTISLDASPSKETKFAFDDATINPVSPVLSSSDSGDSIAVIEVIDDMQLGCFIMVISDKTNVHPKTTDDKKEMPDDTPIISKNNCIEWEFCSLSHDLQSINTNNFTLNISDIRALNNLSTNEARQIQSSVEDGKGLTVIGLQSITLVVDSSDYTRYKLIFDSSKTAFVWYKGMKTLGNMLAIQRRPSSVFFAMVVTDIDRISNTIMNDTMPIADNQAPPWLRTIADELPVISSIIDYYTAYAQRSCILDSSEHLSIMCRTISLTNIASELESNLSHISAIKPSMLSVIRECWWTLNSDLAVVILKMNNVRKQLKVFSPMNININDAANIIVHNRLNIIHSGTMSTVATIDDVVTSSSAGANDETSKKKSRRKTSISDRIKSTMDYLLQKASV